MVYSNKEFPNKEFEFPPPPLWLTWYGFSEKWDPKQRKHVTIKGSTGPVRHQDSLAKSKKYLTGFADYNTTKWRVDWAIYEWTGEKYTLRYSGKKGERKSDHPLWKTPIKKHQLQARDVTDDEFQEALASVMGVPSA